jgi:hypothetical protein
MSLDVPVVSWVLLILMISHGIVFGWGVLLGAWVW